MGCRLQVVDAMHIQAIRASLEPKLAVRRQRTGRVICALSYWSLLHHGSAYSILYLTEPTAKFTAPLMMLISAEEANLSADETQPALMKSVKRN